MSTITITTSTTEADLKTKVANATGADVIEFEPRIKYRTITSVVQMPPNVPVFGNDAVLQVGPGGRYEWADPSHRVERLIFDGTKTATGPIFRWGTGAGGKGAKAKLLDVTFRQGGPGDHHIAEIHNLQNSRLDEVRILDNLLCNGLLFDNGCKDIPYTGAWLTSCKHHALKIGTTAGKQRASNIRLWAAGLTEQSTFAAVLGDCEDISFHGWRANTTEAFIQFVQESGRTGHPTGASRVACELLTGKAPKLYTSSYPVTTFDLEDNPQGTLIDLPGNAVAA